MWRGGGVMQYSAMREGLAWLSVQTVQCVAGVLWPPAAQKP